MRKTFQGKVVRAIVDKAYPTSEIERLAEPFVKWLATDASPMVERARKEYEENPDFVFPNNAMVFVRRLLSGVPISDGYIDEVEVPLPFRYAELNDFNGVRSTTPLELMRIDDDEIIDNFPILYQNGPREAVDAVFDYMEKRCKLGNKVKHILNSLDGDMDLFVRLIPDAKAIVEEVRRG